MCSGHKPKPCDRCCARGEWGLGRAVLLKERALAIGELRFEVVDSRHLCPNDQFATGKCIL
jgi:hypothetical protein